MMETQHLHLAFLTPTKQNKGSSRMEGSRSLTEPDDAGQGQKKHKEIEGDLHHDKTKRRAAKHKKKKTKHKKRKRDQSDKRRGHADTTRRCDNKSNQKKRKRSKEIIQGQKCDDTTDHQHFQEGKANKRNDPLDSLPRSRHGHNTNSKQPSPQTVQSQQAKKRMFHPKAYPLARLQLSQKIYDLVQQAQHHDMIKKGANEATKSLNRDLAELIILAADTEPLEIVLHLPLLCEDKNVPYIYIPSKAQLGRATGVSRNVIALAIIRDEKRESMMKQIEYMKLLVEKELFS